jgi:hypothetical protein
MKAQRGLIMSAVATLFLGTGCFSCGHQGYGLARDAAVLCDLPSCQRNQVYLFAMSGVNPISMLALDSLREQVNRNGFAKVATGQTIHASWMAREMQRIHSEDPQAVFVVLGYESAAPAAQRLSEQAQALGLPVGGLVVITTDAQADMHSSEGRTLLISSSPPCFSSPLVELTLVPEVTSFGLASHARTIAAITNLLSDLAAAMPIVVVEEVTGWEYPHAPPMRAMGDPSRNPDWLYLFDHYQPATPLQETVDPSVATSQSDLESNQIKLP